jgi:hypothetical protein
METRDYQPRVEEKVIKIKIPALWVPHHKGKIAFAPSFVGPNTYRNVGSEILKNGQQVPTGDYTASLIHPIYCASSVTNVSEFANIRSRMRNDWLWVFIRLGFTNKGVYSLQDLEAIGRSQPLDIAELERMLKGGKELSWGGIRFSEDGKVRFAPKGSYVLGERTSEQLAKDGLMIVTYDVEGAEKCAEASKTRRHNPITYGVDVSQEGVVEERVSAVFENVDRLHFYGYDWLDYNNGYAFGVL